MDGGLTQYEITGLTPETHYDVSLRAKNSRNDPGHQQDTSEWTRTQGTTLGDNLLFDLV